MRFYTGYKFVMLIKNVFETFLLQARHESTFILAVANIMWIACLYCDTVCYINYLIYKLHLTWFEHQTAECEVVGSTPSVEWN